jgi:magnesium transporter
MASIYQKLSKRRFRDPLSRARRRVFRQRAKKVGLPPGTLIYPPERKGPPARVTMIDYDENRVVERELGQAEECRRFKENQTSVTWINVDEITQPGLLEEFGRVMGYHSLMLEDILNTDQRPKIEDFGDYLYIVVKMLDYDNERQEIVVEQLSLVVGASYVISFQERPGDFFDPVRNRIRNNVGRIRKLGADYLAYALLDIIVDNYFVVLEKIGDRIEALEEVVVSNPRPGTEKQIFQHKRDMIFVRKAAWPMREMVANLQRMESPLIREGTAPFLRDLQDHILQVTDAVDTFRDLLNGMMDSYYSTITTRTSGVMKVLALFSTIFMPLTFITGIFGMNFRHFPELEWHNGFQLSLILMGVTTVIMVAFFFYKKWL